MSDEPTKPTAEQIAEVVLSELNERGGFDHWWDGIDSDIQDEIKQDLIQAILRLGYDE